MGTAILALVLVLTSVVLNALTLSLLWQWIIVGTFGVAALTLGQAYGVSVFVSFFKAGLATKTPEKGATLNETLVVGMVEVVLFNLLFLVLGFIASLFI